MVKAIIDLDEREDQVLNIVKATKRLKNKSEAIKLIIKNYEETKLEPELRLEYLDRLNNIKKEKYHRFNSIDGLRKLINNV